MIVTFFGSPGSGKGTQAELAAEALGLAHVSTGKHFRREIQRNSALGSEIRDVIEAGNLVTDDIVNDFVFQLIDGIPGVLLDGYPRNVFQAGSLDDFLLRRNRKLDVAVFLDVPEADAVGRLAGRRHCTSCGTLASFSDETCNSCGAALVRRTDDDPEVIHRRFEEYRRQTTPLEAFYAGRLVKVDGMGTVERVHSRVLKELEPWL
jgi:adenylate kinase